MIIHRYDITFIFGMVVNLHDSMSEECHTHLVSFIKHHGLFVTYMVTNFFFNFENLDSALQLADIFYFLIRES